MPAAAKKLSVPSILSIPLAAIRESPTNPRKVFNPEQLEELAQDVKVHGVLQPVMVRPAQSVLGRGGSAATEDRYELVFGHRRFRAAKLAGLKEIPALVRELSDQETLEIQLVENCKRSDLHPLEEADGYGELHEKHGLSADAIAEKIGKSKSYVYQRMKLRALAPAAREAFLSGELEATVAVLIARFPETAQGEALEEATRKNWDGRLRSYRDISHELHAHFMQDLSDAPFDTEDTTLISDKPACSVCPYRSDGSTEGIAANVCTNTGCFRMKCSAAADAKVEQAQAAGVKVLEEDQAKKALNYGSGYVKLTEKCVEDPKRRTWAEVLAKESVEKVVAVADGGAHELVKVKEAKEALKESGKKWAEEIYVPREATPGDSYSAQQREQQKAAKLRRQVVCEALRELQNQVGPLSHGDDLGFTRYLAQLQLEHAGWDELHVLAGVRGVDAKDMEKVRREIRKGIEVGSIEDLRGTMVQLLVAGGAAGGSWSNGYGKSFTAACGRFGVDFRGIEKQLKGAAKEKTKAKAPKKSRKGAA